MSWVWRALIFSKLLVSPIGRGGVGLNKPEAGHLQSLSFPAMAFSDPSP
jgi:hypothetical protein